MDLKNYAPQTHSMITTDTTPVNIGAFTIPVNSIATMSADVTARTSGGVRATWKMYGSAGREEGDASIISGILNIVSPRKDLAASLWNASIGLSGNDFVVTVTGGLATTITWTIVTTVTIHTP